jgi:glyoxylase-like metal-dependent hydrolase (beta-lactamase superfamily II)
MNRPVPRLRCLTAALAFSLSAAQAASVQSSAEALGVAGLDSVSFSGNGNWYQFGQAPTPGRPWPAFDLLRYSADIDYLHAASHVQHARKQIIEPDRQRPAPTEQKADLFLSGGVAWNLGPAPGGAPDSAPVPSLQAAAAEERAAEIVSTPQGFLRAALSSNASEKTVGDHVEVSFSTDGRHHYAGTINARSEVEQVQTWIDNPVTGDTLYQTRFSEYRDFGGLRFPSRILRTEAGNPILDLKVAAVTRNAVPAITVPKDIVGAKAPAVAVNETKLAPGVWYLTGGTHHSVAIEQADHVVLVEAPLNEERSNAVIAKVRELAPNKPIRFVINTHVHFDHSGGLRTLVDEGAVVVTHDSNVPYYIQAWSAPRTLHPDRLSASGRQSRFQSFTDKTVLTDGAHRIEIYPVAGNGHADGFALVYLPAEKILVEADAWNPTASNAVPTGAPNPYTVNLYENIQKYKLDVAQIAALHGPRLTTLADLRVAIGQPEAAKQAAQ